MTDTFSESFEIKIRSFKLKFFARAHVVCEYGSNVFFLYSKKCVKWNYKIESIHSFVAMDNNLNFTFQSIQVLRKNEYYFLLLCTTTTNAIF